MIDRLVATAIELVPTHRIMDLDEIKTMIEGGTVVSSASTRGERGAASAIELR